ncbi:hypothetical protein [Chloracidobacterium aggregatum]|jgi:hypothetical protein|uniref:hypothetical protein n=1 Tax=Chloracidobacterium aggregatum TaxID=2851959 RepID=UPI001B8D32DC|nr:hypothetical protein [Chloracidobacterium aggregatum]QUV84971.1 hypothetical protein J8C03_01425 [Chloracidobacterium sp. 2]QUV88625.1 hypothetical protein J8C07_04710 [Chloracidobacterium sp. S]QUV91547.1 hypothetical protein J8C04_03855 [Chloracidobacterium sp. A]QUV97927.1 hypothetical protein J8C00_05640 [Chloracidobacterium sp. E]
MPKPETTANSHLAGNAAAFQTASAGAVRCQTPTTPTGPANRLNHPAIAPKKRLAGHPARRINNEENNDKERMLRPS